MRFSVFAIYIFCMCFSICFLPACSPTVKVEAPDKPITVNLNVKIDHQVQVKVDKDLDKILGDDSDLF